MVSWEWPDTEVAQSVSWRVFVGHGQMWPQVTGPNCLEVWVLGRAQFRVKLIPMWGLIFPAWENTVDLPGAKLKHESITGSEDGGKPGLKPWTNIQLGTNSIMSESTAETNKSALAGITSNLVLSGSYLGRYLTGITLSFDFCAAEGRGLIALLLQIFRCDWIRPRSEQILKRFTLNIQAQTSRNSLETNHSTWSIKYPPVLLSLIWPHRGDQAGIFNSKVLKNMFWNCYSAS